MRKDALRAMINSPFKKVFMRKEKKKTAIKCLITFFISYKSIVKNLLKQIANHYPKSTR